MPRTDRSAVRKALDICLALGESESGLHLSDLARRVGLHRATAHRSLAELLERGFVMRDGEGGYTLGPALIRLSGAPAMSSALARLALPRLHRILERVEMIANAQTLEAGGTRVIAAARSPRYRSVHIYSGELLPVHCTAGGLVQVAFLEPEQRIPYVTAALSDSTNTLTAEDLQRHFDVIRSERTFVLHGRLDPLLSTVAKPVFSAPGRCRCALAVVGLTTELEGERLAAAEAALDEAVADFEASFMLDVEEGRDHHP